MRHARPGRSPLVSRGCLLTRASNEVSYRRFDDDRIARRKRNEANAVFLPEDIASRGGCIRWTGGRSVLRCVRSAHVFNRDRQRVARACQIPVIGRPFRPTGG